MFYTLMFEFMLLGIFYRNCLKVEDMIFHPLYSKVFVPMVKSGNRFLHFIAYPLGFYIYCSTFKIAEELKEKADKGEATVEDVMAALMLAAIMKKESKED